MFREEGRLALEKDCPQPVSHSLPSLCLIQNVTGSLLLLLGITSDNTRQPASTHTLSLFVSHRCMFSFQPSDCHTSGADCRRCTETRRHTPTLTDIPGPQFHPYLQESRCVRRGVGEDSAETVEAEERPGARVAATHTAGMPNMVYPHR